MAQYKGLLVFNGGRQGWTETYYLLGSTASAAALNLLAVVATREAILHQTLIILAGTISDVHERGDSMVVLSEPSLGDAVDPTGYIPLDMAVLIKWQVGIFNRNKTYLRGIPLGQQTDGATEFSFTFLGLLNDYFTSVIANCLFPVTVRNPTPPPNYTVSSYAPATSGSPNAVIARRKCGRPIGLPRGRRVAP
jgi:hypothetical protein